MARLFLSKKADFNVLLAIIGVVLVGIILLLVGYKIIMGGNKMNQDEKCRLSIFAASQAASIKAKTLGTVDIVPTVECATEDIIIKPQDVKRSKNGRIDDDLVKAKIADELYKCWNKVGQGKLDPFRDQLKSFSDRTYCMMCSTIRFSDDFIKEAETESYVLQGTLYWMAIHRIPGTDMTYYEYVNGVRPSLDDLKTIKDNTYNYYTDLNQKYIVTWREQVIDNRLLKLGSIFIPGAFLAVNLVVANGNTLQGVFFLKEEQLSGKINADGKDRDTCTIMIN